MDACWAIKGWGSTLTPLEVIAERESIYRLLGQTTPENLNRDYAAYTLDPHTRLADKLRSLSTSRSLYAHNLLHTDGGIFFYILLSVWVLLSPCCSAHELFLFEIDALIFAVLEISKEIHGLGLKAKNTFIPVLFSYFSFNFYCNSNTCDINSIKYSIKSQRLIIVVNFESA
jgi:hypothetical protein